MSHPPQIYQRQIMKSDLASTTMDEGGPKGGRGLSQAELKQLFGLQVGAWGFDRRRCIAVALGVAVGRGAGRVCGIKQGRRGAIRARGAHQLAGCPISSGLFCSTRRRALTIRCHHTQVGAGCGTRDVVHGGAAAGIEWLDLAGPDVAEAPGLGAAVAAGVVSDVNRESRAAAGGGAAAEAAGGGAEAASGEAEAGEQEGGAGGGGGGLAGGSFEELEDHLD